MEAASEWIEQANRITRELKYKTFFYVNISINFMCFSVSLFF